MKEYFKVVYRHEGTLISFEAPSNQLTLYYPLDWEIVAPVGGLLVFEDWQYAKNFFHGSLDSRILVCHGWDEVPLPPERFAGLLSSAKTSPEHPTYERLKWWLCEELWERGIYHREIARYTEWPEGTVAVKRLVPKVYINPW